MKKVIVWLPAAVLACGMLIVSCSKSNEATVSQGGNTDTTGTGGGTGSGGGCDTTNMQYAANVLPIIRTNCYSCHGNGSTSGGISLDSYTKLKAQVDNGNLIGAITHASGYTPMPYNGSKLSDCDINKIKGWITRGAQNN